jgi:Cu-processing system permease protein
VTLTIAADLLRQAILRKWFLGLWLGITAVLLLLGLSLRMDVVEGALAGASLFDRLFSNDLPAAQVALRPVFTAATYVIFYGFTTFLIVATSDFAPALLLPGRIEPILALPVRRYQLLGGTYLGVLALATLAAAYGASGFCLLLGIKTGVWTFRPILAALLMSISFATIYAAMLLAALLVRSAALSAAVGAAVYLLGVVAGFRDGILSAWNEGVARALFAGATLLLPRISALGRMAADIAGARPVPMTALATLVLGFGLFVLATLALSVWLFQRKDY